jgi:hypothetical protein
VDRCEALQLWEERNFPILRYKSEPTQRSAGNQYFSTILIIPVALVAFLVEAISDTSIGGECDCKLANEKDCIRSSMRRHHLE